MYGSVPSFLGPSILEACNFHTCRSLHMLMQYIMLHILQYYIMPHCITMIFTIYDIHSYSFLTNLRNRAFMVFKHFIITVCIGAFHPLTIVMPKSRQENLHRQNFKIWFVQAISSCMIRLEGKQCRSR